MCLKYLFKQMPDESILHAFLAIKSQRQNIHKIYSCVMGIIPLV